jgi:hypothetical protein
MKWVSLQFYEYVRHHRLKDCEGREVLLNQDIWNLSSEFLLMTKVRSKVQGL